MPAFSIEPVNELTQGEAKRFLLRFEDTSMFLLGNLESQGFRLTQAASSGNFRILRDGVRVVGVFCVTRQGNILIQSEVAAPVFEPVLQACLSDGFPIKGVFGEGKYAAELWEFLKLKRVISKVNFASQELLYSLEMAGRKFEADPGVRLLVASDYEQWKPLRLRFFEGEGIPNDLPDEKLRELFLSLVDRRLIWGFSQAGILQSIANLNAKALDLGQVGGVYTPPEYRRRGLSKKTMLKLLQDSGEIHGLRKIILFTGENNLAAQEMYLKLGFRRLGYFGMFLGE